MARQRASGIPRSSSGSDIAPLRKRRITRARLHKVFAFQSEDERDVMRYDKATKRMVKTGETEMRTSIKLCLYWDSHEVQRDFDGEVIYDEDTGEPRPHYVVDGFVTLSDHFKSNLVSKILPAIGFSGPEYFIPDGKNKGNMTPEFADSLEAVFGENALGETTSDGWAGLPFYERGGEHRKGEVEVEVTSLKLGGYELIGREVDLQIGVDENSNFNRIEGYMIPEDFAGLDNEPLGRQAAPAPAKAKAKAKAQAPADDEALPKHQAYARDVLNSSGVAPIWHAPVLRYLLTDDSIQTIEDLSTDAAKTLRALVKEQGENYQAFITAAYESVSNNPNPPFESDDGFDDDDDDDDFDLPF